MGMQFLPRNLTQQKTAIFINVINRVPTSLKQEKANWEKLEKLSAHSRCQVATIKERVLGELRSKLLVTITNHQQILLLIRFIAESPPSNWILLIK